MNADQLAARRLRQARWLIGLATPNLGTSVADRVEMVWRILGELAGDYQPGEVEKWAAIQERIPEMGPV